jgi:hypothetical protein
MAGMSTTLFSFFFGTQRRTSSSSLLRVDPSRSGDFAARFHVAARDSPGGNTLLLDGEGLRPSVPSVASDACSNVVGADRVATECSSGRCSTERPRARVGMLRLRGMRGTQATATQGAAPGITPQLVTHGRVWGISTSDADRLRRGPVRRPCDGDGSRHAERCLSDAAADPASYPRILMH